MAYQCLSNGLSLAYSLAGLVEAPVGNFDCWHSTAALYSSEAPAAGQKNDTLSKGLTMPRTVLNAEPSG